MKPLLYIVLVVYKTELKNCQTFIVFNQYKKNLEIPCKFLIYNNSNDIIIKKEDWFDVENAGENNMLVGAYNFALQKAKESGTDWLMLLDQDTVLTPKYFTQLSNILSQGIDEKVAALVPVLYSENRNVISPKCYNHLLGPFFRQNTVLLGEAEKCLFAMNSAVVLRVSSIDEIGGFSEKFPLDYLDYDYFYQLFRKGNKFLVFDTDIEHHLSVKSYSQSMNEARYVSIVESENRFARQLGIMALIVLRFRLFVRTLKQLLVPSKRKYSRITCKYIFK